jgi:hypothetical protein
MDGKVQAEVHSNRTSASAGRTTLEDHGERLRRSKTLEDHDERLKGKDECRKRKDEEHSMQRKGRNTGGASDFFISPRVVELKKKNLKIQSSSQ